MHPMPSLIFRQISSDCTSFRALALGSPSVDCFLEYYAPRQAFLRRQISESTASTEAGDAALEVFKDRPTVKQ